MSWFTWIILGVIAGAIAHRVLDSRGGLVSSLVVGLFGALIGGEVAHLFGLHVTGRFLDQLILAIVGAVIFLFVWRKIAGGR